MSEEIEVKTWYKVIVEDIAKIIDAVEYFQKVHQFGEGHTKMKGIIYKLFEEQPQIMQTYELALVDCAMIHKWLEEQIKYQKARKRIEFMGDLDLKTRYGDLKKTDIDNFVAADETLRWYVELALLVELSKNQLENLVNRLNKRGIYLTMMSKLRIAGEHEAYIDTTKETNIENL